MNHFPVEFHSRCLVRSLKKTREGLKKQLDFFFQKGVAFFTDIFHRIVRGGCGLCRFLSHRKLSAILGSNLEYDSKTLAMRVWIKKGNTVLQSVRYQGSSCTRGSPRAVPGPPAAVAVTSGLVRNATYWSPPTPDLLNRRLWRWGLAIWILIRLPDDSATH